MNFELESYDIDELQKCLKPYQAKIIIELLKSNTPEQAIEIYLSAQGPTNTVPFGGSSASHDTKPFLNRFTDEFDKFICGHPDYSSFYTDLEKSSKSYSTSIISAISSAVGASLGLSAALITPVVVLSLSLLGTMGRKAYCANKVFNL
jgi:hypothetical protein